MKAKINICSALICHFSTLKDHKTQHLLVGDILTFFVFPIVIATAAAILGFDFDKDVINVFVTASAIFTGLLLNLLVLVYDQKAKLPRVNVENSGWEKLELKHTLLTELYYNISYSTFVALLLLVLAVVHLNLATSIWSLNVPKHGIVLIDISSFITTPLIIFFGLSLFLTILMVLKRIYSLLVEEA
jgi:hypothetical protein